MVIYKKIFTYIIGLFILSLGISISILATLGVSPVSSLPYALALSFPLSVGMMSIIMNILFVILQIIVAKSGSWSKVAQQLLITFLFGFFMDFTLWLAHFLPNPFNLTMQFVYLGISLIVIAIGLLLYLNTSLPVMPYDGLTVEVSKRFKLPFGKAKIYCDLLNVMASLAVSFAFVHSFGSIGIGTFIAAYGIGKVLGIFVNLFKDRLIQWMNHSPREKAA